jgi:hypothetical protein
MGAGYTWDRRRFLRLFVLTATASVAGGRYVPTPVHAATLPLVMVWKDANCGCCEGWVRHMRQAGFSVMVRDSNDMAAVKKARGVPDVLQSCHTAVVHGYVIEGHVPASDVERLVTERPTAKGLAVPGMPASAPGMDRPGQAYTVVLFGTAGDDRIYARH